MAEVLFVRSPNAATTRPRKNVFQNLPDGSALWRTAVGKGYEDLLTPTEMADLFRLFQQRHLLTHCEGIVDQGYITKSGDATYTLGQRLVIRDIAISRLADLVANLIEELKRLV